MSNNTLRLIAAMLANRGGRFTTFKFLDGSTQWFSSSRGRIIDSSDKDALHGYALIKAHLIQTGF